MSDVLAIVPCRADSKEIPGKNFRPLVGHTPVDRALFAIQGAGIKNIVCTTNDKERAKELPGGLYAPAPLHTDTCSMVSVVLDVLERVPGPDDQIVLLVQPTQPLRQANHLRRAISLMEDGFKSLVSIVRCPPLQKLYTLTMIEGLLSLVPASRAMRERRQDCESTYRADGTVYGFRRKAFLDFPAFITAGVTKLMEISELETCQLDTKYDWFIAETLVGSWDFQRQVGLDAASSDPGHGLTFRGPNSP